MLSKQPTRKLRHVHNRFLVYMVIIIVLTMLGEAILTRYQFNSILRTEAENTAREFAKNLRNIFAPLLVTYNYTTIGDNVETFNTQSGVVYLAVYDKELNLVAANPLYIENKNAVQRLSGLALAKVTTLGFQEKQLELPVMRSVRILDIQCPVYLESSPVRWGVIHAGLSLESNYAHLRLIHQWIAVSLAMSLLVIYLLLRYLSMKMIQRPVDTLIKGAEKIASGNLKFHFDLKENNEFGLLATSFNTMVDKVDQLQARLESWNRDLEQRIAERTQALQQTQQLLESVFNSLTECIITIDQAGQLTSANQQFFTLTGMNREDLGKQLSLSFFNQRVVKFCFVRGFLRALAGEKKRFVRSVCFQRQNLLLDVEISPLYGNIGKKPEVLIIIRDITRQHEIEQQLLNARKMESIGTLTGGIAHDFNNILTAIIPTMDWLREKVQDSRELAQKVEVVQKSARRAAELTAQLMTFSLRKETMLRPLDLNKVVESVVDSELLAYSNTIQIEKKIDSTLSRINGDERLLVQILHNLLSNSIAAMPQGGRIVISTSDRVVDEEFRGLHPEVPREQYVNLNVTDNGIGIKEEYLDRIFDPFFTTKEAGGGQGLGLAMVYGAVKAHRGYIFCQSELGRGSEFQMLFPAVRESLEQSGELQLSSPGGTEKILVVEDEELIRDMGRDLLSELGYHVDVAGNGAEALKILDQERGEHKLVLLDMVMPGMDGLSTLKEIRRQEPMLPVIIISGYDTDERISSALAMERVVFLPKPYKIDELAVIVRSLLDTVAS